MSADARLAADQDPAPERSEAAPDAGRFSLRFTARDLVNVALFAVLNVVIVFAVGMLGVVNPLVWLISMPLSAIIAGVPFMLFIARVRHAGMVALFGSVVALLYLLLGHPWQSTLLSIVLALVAEVVLATGRYRSVWAGVWTYTVFSAWYIGPLIPLLVDRDSYLNAAPVQQMGAEYVAGLDAVVSPTAIVLVGAACVVAGFLGGLLGAAMVRKHFRKGGLA